MLHSVLLVSVVLVILIGSAAIGASLQRKLNEGHRSSQTSDHVRLVISILVTITALVLSLLLSEVKGSFDTFDARTRAYAGDLSNLDLHLREYGGEVKPIRAKLRQYVAAAIADSWRDEPPPPGDYPKFAQDGGVDRKQLGAMLVKMDTDIHRLEPPDSLHQRLAQSLSQKMDDVLDARRRLIETAHDTVTWPLMVAMSVWLCVVFGVFGLLAPRNAVVHLTILICAVCVASTMLLIDGYDTPLSGFLHVPSDAMHDTLSQIDEPEISP